MILSGKYVLLKLNIPEEEASKRFLSVNSTGVFRMSMRRVLTGIFGFSMGMCVMFMQCPGVSVRATRWPELILGIFFYYSPHIVYGGMISCFCLLHAEL